MSVKFLWALKFISSSSHEKFFLVLFQATVLSVASYLDNAKRTAIYFKLFWYNVFVHLKPKLPDFLSDFVFSITWGKFDGDTRNEESRTHEVYFRNYLCNPKYYIEPYDARNCAQLFGSLLELGEFKRKRLFLTRHSLVPLTVVLF